MTEAVTIPAVPAGSGDSETEALGAVLATVTAGASKGSLCSEPSEAVTITPIESPRSPRPATDRSSVDPVAPAMFEPFFVHW